jgi:uncharacterized protein YndB with AHSA1/START domain
MTELHMGPPGENVLVRHINASPKVVWDLWTTPEGISAWWGPAGCTTVVSSLDLKAGGRLSYTIQLNLADQMEQAAEIGAPPMLNGEVVFLEVEPLRRLAYRHLTDFFPDVEPYWNTVAVDLYEPLVGGGVGMVVTWSPLHTEATTAASAQVWDDELRILLPLAEK